MAIYSAAILLLEKLYNLLTKMARNFQTCSGESHSRMSDETTVTSPFHSSSFNVSNLEGIRWRLQKSCQFKGKKYVQYCSTYVTTAFGFFSTAYILTFRPDSSAAVSDALTKGPRPAPTTIITLKRKQTFLNFPLRSIRISLILLIPGWEQNPRLVFFLQQATTAAGIFLSQKWFYTE